MNTHNDCVCVFVCLCVCDVHVLSIGECVFRSYNSTLQNRMERCDAAASSGRWECQVMSLTLVRLVLMGTCVRVCECVSQVLLANNIPRTPFDVQCGGL